MNLPMHRLPKPERLGRIVDRLTTRSRLKMCTMDISRLEEELKIVQKVYNATLERIWGFVPISMEDLLAAADEIRAIADPKLLLIAEMDGKNAGVDERHKYRDPQKLQYCWGEMERDWAVYEKPLAHDTTHF